MEEQILILLQQSLKQPFNEEVCEEIAAKEITSMVMEFIKWKESVNCPFGIMMPSFGDTIYIHFFDGSEKKYTLNEVFDYWINNTRKP